MNVSPYLSAIQALNGKSPGDKYKELHSIAAQIIKDDQEKEDFLRTGISQRVEPAMLPHLHILVGNKLKLDTAIIEGLKSDDVTIIKQALGAKWFFNRSNVLINSEYFMSNVIPYISIRTRLELIKTISHCLVAEPKRAEAFFECFSELCGIHQALPLIVVCSEKYIFDTIIQRKIILPTRILSLLYRRYPELVIRYLHLGNKDNKQYQNERNIHEIPLANYVSFLPVLIKHHTKDFIQLYKYLTDNCYVIEKLGSTRAELFLKNATEELIENPTLLLNLLPLKLVCNKLNTHQFEAMFKNFFTKSSNYCFPAETMFSFLKYYPQAKQLEFLMDKHQLVYHSNFLDDHRIFNSPIFHILPLSIREKCGRKLVNSFTGKPEFYNYVSYLPPKESIPLLKERILKPSDTPRSTWISAMIDSCYYYDSLENLLEVLQYYNGRHKNEQACVLYAVLNSLTIKFDIKLLDKLHWQEIKDIIQRMYIKGELKGMPVDLYKRLFEGALNYFLKQCGANIVEEENKVFLDKLIHIILECYLEHGMQWIFVSDSLDNKRDCLEKLLIIIPQKYPETHMIWRKFNKKLSITLSLIQSMQDLKVSNLTIESKKRYSGSNELKQIKVDINQYTWLTKFVVDILKTYNISETKKSKDLRELTQALRNYDLKFYQNIIDENENLINDVETNDAVVFLKHNHNKVLAKWNQYLTYCREHLHRGNRATKYFVASTKWHQDIPIKFVEQCLREINIKGSTFILGILIDGESFGKIIEPYLPKNKKMDVNDEDAKRAYDITSTLPKAINFTNPPVRFSVLSCLCQGDYVSLAAQTLTNVAQRVPVNKVLAFANELVNKPISVKKLGLRLIQQVATKTEILNILRQMWAVEKNPAIRELLAKMIFNLFKQLPNNESWDLMKVCIEGLTGDDQTIYEMLRDLSEIDLKYIGLYIETLLMKVDKSTLNELEERKKMVIIKSIVKSISRNILSILPENLITYIINKYFFEIEVSFIVNIYLFSNSEKFEERLNILIHVLENEIKNFNKPDPNDITEYPANNRICRFFKRIINIAPKEEENKRYVKFIDRLLNLFSTVLKPWNESQSFIILTLRKLFHESESLKDFGIKCAKQISRFIEIFKSEIIIHDIVTGMQDIMNIYNYGTIQTSEKLLVLEGLSIGDEYFGILVAVKMFKDLYVDKTNYPNNLIQLWSKKENIVIQTALSQDVFKSRYIR